jgi:predicted DNA-binding protein (UPF0251 family)
MLDKNMFKSVFIQNIYNELKEKLLKIAKEHNLNYEELEELYLKDMKDFTENIKNSFS